jgi:hypothetical protein
VRVSPLRSAGPGGDTLIAGTRGRRVGSHTARPAHAADPANISHRLLAQRKAQDLVSSSRPFKQLSARQRNTKENAQIIQLHEKSCRFVVCTPKRVTTTTEVVYLLEGNDKYGEKHIEKHCPELTNVAKRRGWVGSIDDILRFAITQSTYTAYQVPDDRGSAICIPVTARKMMFLPIAEDGKIITAMIKDSETKAIKLFWSNGPDEIQDIGWKIVRGEDNRSMADAPWDLYTKSL